MPYQHARIQISNSNNTVFFQVLLKAFARALPAERFRKIIDHQTADLWAVGFLLFIDGTVITDVRRRIDNNLTEVGRISINFLVAGHACVKADLPSRSTDFSDGGALYKKSILKKHVGFFCQWAKWLVGQKYVAEPISLWKW